MYFLKKGLSLGPTCLLGSRKQATGMNPLAAAVPWFFTVNEKGSLEPRKVDVTVVPTEVRAYSGWELVTPVPVNGTFTAGVAELLTKMGKFEVNIPALIGEKSTVNVFDCPGVKVKFWVPPSRENGPVGFPMLPVKFVVALAGSDTVTVALPVCPTSTFPKSIEVGLTVMEGAGIPAPLKGTIAMGVLDPLAEMGTFEVKIAGVIGEKSTVNVFDWPGVKVKFCAPPSRENGATGFPILPVKFAVELAVSDTVRLLLAVCPTTTFPKSMEVGLTVMEAAGIPVPVSGRLAIGVLEPVGRMRKISVNPPAAVGEKSTLMIIDCPGGRTRFTEPPGIEKGGDGFTAVPVKVVAAVAGFVTVTCFSAVCPVGTLPKSREVGLTERTPTRDPILRTNASKGPPPYVGCRGATVGKLVEFVSPVT